jgi:hypothetical protein
MRNVKYMIIPVINGATGTVTRGLETCNIFTTKDSCSRTSHIIRKVLQSERWDLLWLKRKGL